MSHPKVCVTAALVAAALVLAGLPAQGRAQDMTCDTVPNPWEFLRRCARHLVPGDSGAPARLFREAFSSIHSPSTLNAVLGEGTALAGRVNRLGALHLRFVNVSQEGEPSQLGVAFDWRRDLFRTPHRQGSTHSGFAADVTSRGVLTHDDAQNPDDYIAL